jgi:POT family proton-dependent oligopeptide transporter
LGITLTIIGTGFFKPNISSMVGELYKVGDSRRDAGFGLFYPEYWSIVRRICVYLGTSPDYGWSYAFLSAAIVMVIGLLFITKTLGPMDTLHY